MPNVLVDTYRRQFPDSREHDDDITLKYINDLGVEEASKYPGVAEDFARIDLEMRRANAPGGGWLGEAAHVAQGALQGVQGKLYGLAAQAGRATGSQGLEDWGMEGYRRNLEEAAPYGPTIQDPSEIGGLGDLGRYGAGLIASQVPQQAFQWGTTGIGTGLGFLAGGPPGALAGGLWANRLAGYAQGQNFAELASMPGVDQSSVLPTSAVQGVASAALEDIPFARIGGKLFNPATVTRLQKFLPDKVIDPLTRHLPEGQVGDYLRRAARNVPEQALLEAVPEVLQSGAEMASEAFVNKDNPNFQLQNVGRRLAQAGVGGAALGVLAGAGESFIPGPHAPVTPGAAARNAAAGIAADTGDRTMEAAKERAAAGAAGSDLTPPAPAQDWEATTDLDDLALQFSGKVRERGYTDAEAAGAAKDAFQVFDANDGKSPAEIQPLLDEVLARKWPVVEKAAETAEAATEEEAPVDPIAAATAAAAAKEKADTENDLLSRYVTWLNGVDPSYQATLQPDGSLKYTYEGKEATTPRDSLLDYAKKVEKKLPPSTQAPAPAASVTAAPAAPTARAEQLLADLNAGKSMRQRADIADHFAESVFKRGYTTIDDIWLALQEAETLKGQAPAVLAANLNTHWPVKATPTVTPAASVTAAPAASVTAPASVPLIITKAMEAEMLGLGQTQEQINAMTPQAANTFLAAARAKPAAAPVSTTTTVTTPAATTTVTREPAAPEELPKPEAPKPAPALTPEQEAKLLKKATESGQYIPAVKSESGKVFASYSHEAALAQLARAGEKPTKELGYVDNAKPTEYLSPADLVKAEAARPKPMTPREKKEARAKATEAKRKLRTEEQATLKKIEEADTAKKKAQKIEEAKKAKAAKQELRDLDKMAKARALATERDKKVLAGVMGEEQEKIIREAKDRATQKALGIDVSKPDIGQQFTAKVDIEGTDRPKHGEPFRLDLPKRFTTLQHMLVKGARADAIKKGTMVHDPVKGTVEKSTTNQGDPAITKRITFFRDNHSNKIVAVGTWRGTSKKDSTGETIPGPVMVVNPEPHIAFEERDKNGRVRKQKRDSRSLAEFLTGNRYTPLASARWKSADHRLKFEFTDQQYQEIVDAVKLEERRNAAGIENAKAIAEAKMIQQPSGAGVDVAAPSQTTGKVVELSPVFLLALHDKLQPFAKDKSLTQDKVLKALNEMASDTSGKEGTGRKALMENIGGSRTGDWLAHQFIPTIIKEFNEQRTATAFKDRIVGMGSGVLAQAADTGSFDEGDTESDALYSKPGPAEPGRATTGEIKRRFNKLQAIARNLGINVDIVKAVRKISGQVDEEGVYEPSTRAITLSLFDAENPAVENLRLLLHEIAHDVSASLPKDLRKIVHEAIESFSDAELNLQASDDPRITPRPLKPGETAPEKLSKSLLPEERLAESLAIAGLNEELANSLAARIVRFVKELYYRAALAWQGSFGRTPDPATARAFVKNRFDRALAAGERGISNFLVPPNRDDASISEHDKLYSKPSGVTRVGERVDPRVIIESRIAALNEQVDFEKKIETQLQSVPAAVSAAASKNMPILDWWRQAMHLDNPQDLINAEKTKTDPTTGLLIGPNPTVRIGSFAAEQNNQLAAQEALETASKQLSSITEKIAAWRKEERQHDAMNAVAAKAHQDLLNQPVPTNPKDAAKRTRDLQRLANSAQAHADIAQKAGTKARTASQVEGLYKENENRLMGPLGAHKPVLFGHDEEFWVPKDVNATGPGNGFDTLKIKLDQKGGITQKSEIQEAIDKMGEWLKDPRRVKDGVYNRVQAMQDELMIHGRLDTDRRNVDNTLRGLNMASMAEQAKALGTPLWRYVSQMINRYADQQKFLRSTLTPMAREVERHKHEARNALGLTREQYMKNIYDKAVNFLESRRDIVEAHPSSFKRQMDEGMKALQRHFEGMTDGVAARLKGQEQKVMNAVRKHVEAEWAISKTIQQHSKEWGNNFVRDPKIGGMSRGHIQQGIITMPRRISQTFNDVFDALAKSGWAGAMDAFAGIADTYNSMGPDQVRAQVDRLFNNADAEIQKMVQKHFFRALVQDTGSFSNFNAPALANGTTPEANPAFAKKAYEQSGGDPVKFFELMYDMHQGQTDKGAYVQQGLETMARHFNDMKRVMEQVDPTGMKMPKDIKTMIPGIMVSAREVAHWPSDWFDAMSFDPHSINRVTDRVAAQSVFGNDNERLAKAYGDGVKEFNGDMASLKTARTAVTEDLRIPNDKNAIEKALEQKLGGKEELERLKSLESKRHLVEGTDSIRDQLVKTFASVDRSPSALRSMISLFASLMVNQPGSAIGQSIETASPFIALGSGRTAAKMTARNIAGTAREMLGSLPQALGLKLKKDSRWDQRAREMGLRDYEADRSIKDIWNEPNHPDESQMSIAARKLQAMLGVSMGSGDYTALRPLALFKQMNIAMHIEGTKNFWRQADEWVRKGVEWAKANPTEFKNALADEEPRKWADRLKIGDREAFGKFFQKALDDSGMDFFGLVKEGMQNEKSGKDLLSNMTLARLQGMWVKESVSESNISTTSSAAETNSVIKDLSPLLAWSWRRARQVAGLRLDEKDKGKNYKAIANNLAGLAILGGGGLAVSGLVDLYNEELQHKRRNLRRLTLEGGVGNALRAGLEHSARVGTGGMITDLANALMGSVSGDGDNRGTSIDQRTVFINSMQGLIRAFTSLINQGGDIDYTNVVRPALFSMGGNGALQYMQVMNTVLGLDNVESRAVARTNVGNWLKVIGRELGMEVAAQRGFSTPTAITPNITRMQMAALADNMEDFQKAKMAAIAAAREKHPDAAEYIARTFAARNPLRTAFKTPPSEREYREILSALPEQGRQDVMEAVNLFNRYGASMGVQPFDGKAESGAGKAAKAQHQRIFGGGSRSDFTHQAARERARAF